MEEEEEEMDSKVTINQKTPPHRTAHKSLSNFISR